MWNIVYLLEKYRILRQSHQIKLSNVCSILRCKNSVAYRNYVNNISQRFAQESNKHRLIFKRAVSVSARAILLAANKPLNLLIIDQDVRIRNQIGGTCSLPLKGTPVTKEFREREEARLRLIAGTRTGRQRAFSRGWRAVYRSGKLLESRR